jgi:hypothetical protein
VSGFLTHHGVALEGPITVPTWPTPAAALTSLLAFTSATVEPMDRFAAREVFGGMSGTLTVDAVAQTAACQVTAPLTALGQESLLACALGYAPRVLAGTTYPVALGSGVWRHRLELVNQLRAMPWPAADGIATSLLLRRLTLVLGSPVDVYEVQSGMLTGWQLTAQPDSVRLQVAAVGATLETATPVNTWATLTALPPPVAPDLADVDLVCRFGPLSATTPPGATDEIDIMQVTLQCQRPWRLEQSLSSGLLLAEPSCTGVAVVTGSLTVPWYTPWAHDLLAAIRAQTPYTLELRATWPGSPTVLRLWGPACHLDAVTRPWTAAAPTAQIAFTVLAPPSVPTWLGGVRDDGRLVVELETTTATHPLLGV